MTPTTIPTDPGQQLVNNALSSTDAVKQLAAIELTIVDMYDRKETTLKPCALMTDDDLTH